MRLNLRLKILIYSSCLLVLLVTVTLLFVSDRAATYANAQIARDLAQARERIARVENERRVGLRESASLVASFPQLRALFGTDPATIADFLVTYQLENQRSELIVAMDRAGQVIARTDFGASPPDAAFHARWIQPVLEQGVAEGVFLTTRGAYDAVAVAAEIGGEVFGFILAAAPIDDRFAAQLSGNDSEILLVGNDVLGSTVDAAGLPGRDAEYWSAATVADGDPYEVTVVGERFTATAVLLSQGAPPVLAVVMQSRDRATEPYRNIQFGLLVLGLLVTGLGVGGSAILAKTITAPVATLVAGTRKVAHGNLDDRLDVTSSDEIGQLVEAFNAMLDERQHLERQVQQSQKMEAVGRLAGGVANDFNRLLSVVSVSAGTLMRSLSGDHPGQRHVRSIQDSAEHGSHLTRQLLAFSQKQDVQPRVLSLDELVTGMKPMLQALVGEAVDLQLDLAAGDELVRADPGRVEQLIVNLALNAGDAMPNGGRLTIATAAIVDERGGTHRPEVSKGKYRVLSVSDTGSGIEDRILDHLFDPFFTTKEAGQGTGLGLFTVYGIVQQSGGYIDVASRLGRGTTFTIYLPADTGATPGISPAAPSTSGFGTETVLLVEPEASVRDLARTCLEEGGYTVLVAANGPAAIALSDGFEGPIHLLLTGVVMPRMSGPELCERLFPDRPEMRVLYLAGPVPSERPPHGATYVEKPLTPATLIPKVDEILGTFGG